MGTLSSQNENPLTRPIFQKQNQHQGKYNIRIQRKNKITAYF